MVNQNQKDISLERCHVTFPIWVIEEDGRKVLDRCQNMRPCKYDHHEEMNVQRNIAISKQHEYNIHGD